MSIQEARRQEASKEEPKWGSHPSIKVAVDTKEEVRTTTSSRAKGDTKVVRIRTRGQEEWDTKVGKTTINSMAKGDTKVRRGRTRAHTG